MYNCSVLLCFMNDFADVVCQLREQCLLCMMEGCELPMGELVSIDVTEAFWLLDGIKWPNVCMRWYPSGPMCVCDGIQVAQCVYAMVSKWPNVCIQWYSTPEFEVSFV